MSRLDASTAEVLVFSFKEGVLSAVAHDLKIQVTRLLLDLEADKVSATFDATSLRVLCPQKNGEDNPGALPKMLYAEIEKNIDREVLDSARHPQIRFVSSVLSDSEVKGQLTIKGVSKEVRGVRKDTASHLGAEFRFDHRDFGIKPFSAMFGTLKVKSELIVRVRVPRP